MELPRGTSGSGGSRQHAKGLNVEYHIVYRKGPVQPVERRRHQQVQFPRIAVFSTYEEARLYIQICALVDRHIHGRGKNGEYRAHALLFDMPSDQYERIVEDDFSMGWKLKYSPYFSPFWDPLQFDGDGQATFHRYSRLCSFETRTEFDYCTQICSGEIPKFEVGDVVFLRWSYSEDTYAVITALGTRNGRVRKLESADVWTGWYDVLFLDGGGVSEEHVHIASSFEMEPVLDELPQQFRILETIARHYRGDHSLSETILNRLSNEQVLALDIEVFPFGLFAKSGASGLTSGEAIGADTCSTISVASTGTSGEKAALENRPTHRPALQPVFVVLRMFMDDHLGKKPVDAFSLHEPPAAFSSLEKANACMAFRAESVRRRLSDDEKSARALMSQLHRDKQPVDLDPGVILAYCDRFQIIELLMPSETITDEDLVQSLAFETLVKHTWCYDVDGKLLWELPDPNVEKSVFKRYAFDGRYDVGDMVYVVPQGLDPESESIEGDIAVVSEVPISKEAWLASGQGPETWNPFYTVDFVDPDYYLQHFRVPESSLLRADFPVRENLAVLPIWSRHLRGELAFPDGLADRIRARTVLLRKCPRFDFSTRCIVE